MRDLQIKNFQSLLSLKGLQRIEILGYLEILESLYRLQDIGNIQVKFENNRSSSFEDYLCNRHRRQQTDGNWGSIFSYCRGYETLRKHRSSYSSGGRYYNTSLGYLHLRKKNESFCLNALSHKGYTIFHTFFRIFKKSTSILNRTI